MDNKLDTCDECYGSGSNTCDMCNGSGAQICSDCDGSGQVTDENDNLDECYDCDGSGTVGCNYCDGEGKVFCNNCGGDGEIIGDEYFDYSLHLMAAITNKSEYNVLRKYEAYNDSDTIEIINDFKYTVSLYEYSSSLEEGDSLFNSREIRNQSNYFFGLLDDNRKNSKYSNFRIGTIEEYV
jgi:RecJ-like exonuclease